MRRLGFMTPKVVEFDHFKTQAGLPNFVLSKIQRQLKRGRLMLLLPHANHFHWRYSRARSVEKHPPERRSFCCLGITIHPIPDASFRRGRGREGLSQRFLGDFQIRIALGRGQSRS